MDRAHAACAEVGLDQLPFRRPLLYNACRKLPSHKWWNPAGDHPKAGKPMTTIDEGAGPDSDGRRSKTPNGGMKLLEANRCAGNWWLTYVVRVYAACTSIRLCLTDHQ